MDKPVLLPLEYASMLHALVTLDAQRAELQRQADKLSENISALRTELHGVMDKHGWTKLASHEGECELKTRNVYKTKSWPDLYAYIQRTGNWQLLHRRLGITACAELDSEHELPACIEQVPITELEFRGIK